jgi:pilus assembly protein CpaB
MRRGRILILLGLILAIGTAAAVFVLLRGAAGEQEAKIEREEVVVAKQPIAEDEPLEGRVELRAMPVDTIPEGAIRSLEETAGMLAAGPINQGAILHPDLLISPLELIQQGELGKLVEEGYVAVAFPIDEMSSVSYGIQPGDHVDILMTFFFVDLDLDTQMIEPLCPPLCPAPEGGESAASVGDQYPRLVTQLTLQNAEVLGVGRWAHGPEPVEEETEPQGEPIEEEPPEFITLMLAPQDALVLKLAREYGASIDLAVRAQDDLQVFTTQQVTLEYMLTRFAVSMPAKQSFTIEDAAKVRLQTAP